VGDSCVELRDVVVVGGGCYGSFYTTQLEAARQRGRVRYRRLLVVDRNAQCQVGLMGAAPGRSVEVAEWDEFFDRFLTDPDRAAGDAIVPSPLMPHLMLAWLLRRARRRWPARAIDLAPFPSPVGTPFEMTAPDETRYVSFADWLCPVTRAPRTWEMGDALTRYGEHADSWASVVLFTCRHRVNGVGMFDVREALDADAAVAAAGALGTGDILVGTVSSCHGAVSRLHIGA
jgi:hypothetical protein